MAGSRAGPQPEVRAFVTWLYRLDLIDRVPAFPVVPLVDHAPTILSETSQRAILEAIPGVESADLAGAGSVESG